MQKDKTLSAYIFDYPVYLLSEYHFALNKIQKEVPKHPLLNLLQNLQN